MLLFINALALSTTGNPLFQYISCYCLSCFVYILLFATSDFNTSHVTVYPYILASTAIILMISIHLMLLFIVFPVLFHQSYQDISIHLMLLFILSEQNQLQP